MLVQNRTSKRPPRRTRTRLYVEPLETRALLTIGWTGLVDPLVEIEPSDTVDVALDLGDPSLLAQTQAIGNIGNSPAEAADVDWYSFTLVSPATVHLTAVDLEGGFAPTVLSLYNNATDVFDQFEPTGRRLLAQNEGVVESAYLQLLLPAGTYSVAVSGAGNRHFYPFLADSGMDGEKGDYALLLETEAYTPPVEGPSVLTASPADASQVDSTPLVVRLTFDAPVDFSTIAPGFNATLTYNVTGSFGDGNDVDVAFLPTYSFSANELQLMPISLDTFTHQPLAPGFYRVFLAADSSAVPLAGDYTGVFEITGSEGGSGANDTPDTAIDLGDVSDGELVQVGGAIGDDSAYVPSLGDPFLFNSAADVDLYHFQITGSDNYGLVVQVSAGAIGYWTLDAAVSLFQEIDGQLILVAVADNTLNDSIATDGIQPLYLDPVLFTGLRAGNYYLAVSGAGNAPDPALGLLPGQDGIFDPAVSHSGMNGYSVGNYVLSLVTYVDNDAPGVEEVSIEQDAVLDASPSQFTVRFDEVVNLQQLAFTQQFLTADGEIAAVFLRGSDGVDYPTRMLSYDAATNTATFLMLDRLPNGVTELHLSGALGLADRANNPLAGSDPDDPTGDFVVTFTLDAPTPGSEGDPLVWLSGADNETLEQPQTLGLLFPHELQAGVVLRREMTADATDTADVYQFTIVQTRGYFFALSNKAGLPASVRPEVFDAEGNRVFLLGTTVRFTTLTPGTYFVRVGGWAEADAAGVQYDLRLTLGNSNENPTPLTAGPAPAYRIRLAKTPTPPPNPGGGSGGTTNPPLEGGGTGTIPGGNTGGSTGGGTGGSTGGGTGGGTGETPRTPPVLVLPSTPMTPKVDVAPAARETSNGPLVLGDILTNSLSQFGERPVGGSRDSAGDDSSVAANRLVLPGSNARQPILPTKSGTNSGGNEEPGSEENPDDVSQSVTPEMQKTWQQFLDLLFGLQFTPAVPDNLQEWLLEMPPQFQLLHDESLTALPAADAACEADAEADADETSRIDLALGLGLTSAVSMLLADRKRSRYLAAFRPAIDLRESDARG